MWRPWAALHLARPSDISDILAVHGVPLQQNSGEMNLAATPSSGSSARAGAGSVHAAATSKASKDIVRRSTLDLFDELDPESELWNTDLLGFLERNPEAKRIWKLERANHLFDARHREVFTLANVRQENLHRRSGWWPADNRLTLIFADYSYTADIEYWPCINMDKDLDNAALVSFMLDDEFGEELLRTYYRERHGMEVVDIKDENPPYIQVTWDLSNVHQMRKTRWEFRMQQRVLSGKHRFEAESNLALMTLGRVLSPGGVVDVALPLLCVRSFLGGYEDQLRAGVGRHFIEEPACKRPRTA